jgi:hypothetical protein
LKIKKLKEFLIGGPVPTKDDLLKWLSIYSLQEKILE